MAFVIKCDEFPIRWYSLIITLQWMKMKRTLSCTKSEKKYKFYERAIGALINK